MSVVSPIQFDVTPKPLLVRKETVVIPADYHISYDHRNDCITIVKTETTRRPSSLPRWQTIREVYFSNAQHKHEDKDQIEPDQVVYEEVTQITQLPDCQKNEQKQVKSIPSLTSLDVSSFISVITTTIYDYLTWTNFFKIMTIAFCINGLLLQTILLTVEYFSYETTVDLKLGHQLVHTSVTLCLPLSIENDSFNQIIYKYDHFSTNISHTNSNKLNTSKERNNISSKHSFNDIFNNIGLNHKKISCIIKTRKTADQNNCDKPVESIENGSKCFTYSLQLKSNSIFLLSANFNCSEYMHNSTSKARISIHSPKTIASVNENEFLPLSLNKKFDIKFWKINIKHLSSPYTSCANYPISWSRFECTHNCITNAIKKSCLCVPKNALILKDDFDHTYHWCPSSSCDEEYESFRIDCNRKCSKDCNQNIYHSIITSINNSNSTISVTISLNKNNYGSNENLIFNQKSALTLELYFASLGGLLVFWALILLISFSIIYLSLKIIKLFALDYTLY